MGEYTLGTLNVSTWDGFADLVERNNGIFGGCWCAAFHCDYHRGADTRTFKEALVRSGDARASLVFDADGAAQGWCQYGPAPSLRLKHEREYLKDPSTPADWRIACIFVDKHHRRQGVARIALEGALQEIVDAGGGLVEAIPESVTGREAQGRFLFSATVELFEDYGFQRGRQVGKHAWVVSKRLKPSSATR